MIFDNIKKWKILKKMLRGRVGTDFGREVINIDLNLMSLRYNFYF